MTMRRPLRLLATCAAAALAATGCGFHGLYGVNLPGGAPNGPSYELSAVFDNVMDLVPQSAVKYADVTVGSVEKITLTKDLKAKVLMRVSKKVDLPANASAAIEQTSLLGEKFVQLQRPTDVPAHGHLEAGATIPLAHTTTLPDVEQVFGLLATVLNGGGLQKVQTISVELSKALSGRETKVKDLLGQLNHLVSNLDSQKAEIVRALNNLDQFSATLVQQKRNIVTALDDLGPGLKVLADNRAQLTELLTSLAKLGDVGTRIIEQSKDATVADLQSLQPILAKIQEAGRSLPDSLDMLLTYPFPDNVVDAIPGDFANLYMTLNINSVCNLVSSGMLAPLPKLPCLGPSAEATPPSPGASPSPSTGGKSGSSGGLLPGLPSLPGLGGLGGLGSGSGSVGSSAGSGSSGSTGSGGSGSGLSSIIGGLLQ